MKRVFLFGLALLLTSLAACQSTKQPSTGHDGSSTGINLLVSVEGSVQLKRAAWSQYSQTTFGAMLFKGDLIAPASGARIVVLCDGLKEWVVPAGAPVGLANGCPPSKSPVLKSGPSLIQSTRGGNDPFIPYIISPRKTKLLNANPLLSWHPAPGAISYKVDLTVAGGTIWTTDTSETNMVYPGIPALQPGVNYLLVVTAEVSANIPTDTPTDVPTNKKITSNDEGINGLGFTLLNPADRQRINEAHSRISGLQLAPDAESLALANLYQGNGLVAEAAQILETLAENQSQASAVYRKLGDLYLQISLNLLAEKNYRIALGLSQTDGDVEGQAMAQNGLGEANAALGRIDEAKNWFNQALDIYKALGDATLTGQINKRVGDLQ
jgi:hypothetical protein